jgi:hypothetical protein
MNGIHLLSLESFNEAPSSPLAVYLPVENALLEDTDSVHHENGSLNSHLPN